MKLYHFTLLYIALAIAVIFTMDVKAKQYEMVMQEKEVIDNAFDTAIDSSASVLLQGSQGRGVELRKEDARNEFFQSLYASLGYLTAKDKQEEIEIYVPMVFVISVDGFYVNYSDQYVGEDGYQYYTKRWSEKLVYHYEDNDFIYGFTLGDQITIYDKNRLLDRCGVIKIHSMDYQELKTSSKYQYFRTQRSNHVTLDDDKYHELKRTVITKILEDSISYYMNIHNYIAHQFGVSYEFQLPIIDNSEFARAISNPSILVMFQGYPYGSGMEQYNRVSVAAAKISKNEVYYMEQKSWYLLYHRSTCDLLDTSTNFIDWESPYYFQEDCIYMGAYACTDCVASGVGVPNYMR